MGEWTLYHTGFDVIERPDIRRGRSNADFGQGFYLSPDLAISRRWARLRAGRETYVNAYALQTDGLRIVRFDRDVDWFNYIFDNRAGRPDGLGDADVVAGPIANDTIYDVWGIATSGYLDRRQAFKLLDIGPSYQQVAIKSPKAAAQLRFLGAEPLDHSRVAGYRAEVLAEQEAFQTRFAGVLQGILDAQPEG